MNAGLRAGDGGRSEGPAHGRGRGTLGGVFRVTDGLQKDFGEDRSSIPRWPRPASSAPPWGWPCAATARCGDPVRRVRLPRLRPDRLPVAKLQFRSRGRLPMPIVIRIPFGGGIGSVEHHCESPEAQFAHTPGLKVVTPGQPRRRLLDDPAGHRLRRPGDLPGAQAPLPADKADLDVDATRRSARTARVAAPGQRRDPVGYGPTVKLSLDRGGGGRRGGPVARGDRPAHALAAGHGPGAAVGAPDRSRRGRARGAVNLGLGAEVAARITEQCFYSLEAPVLRVGGFDTPYPPARMRGGLPARPRPGPRRRRPLPGF